VQAANESEFLLELLVQWEELRQQGKSATPEELCPGNPQLQALLRERLAKRQRLQAVLDLPGETRREQPAAAASLPVIEGYAIGELLGRGGMGVVYRARQNVLQRQVALKIVLGGASASAVERGRFRTEAEAVARLQHPNIVTIYEVGEQGGCPYLALEFVSGGSLAQQLDGTPMPPRRAAQLLLDLARAAQHAHEQGIVHRDLKPANILLTETGTVKVADFGLAKRLDAELGHTQTGAVLGSPSYMAPEQAAGRTAEVGPLTDVYALGAILYELLTGRPPFVSPSVLETLDQVREHEPVAPSSLQPRVSHDLEVICLKCLQKAPADRYSSAAALAADLQAFLEGEPIQARSFTGLEKIARAIRRNRLDERIRPLSTIYLVAGPLCLLLHLAVYLLWGRSPRFPEVIVLVSTVTVLCLPVGILVCFPWLFQALSSQNRRRIWAVWGSNLVGSLLALLIFWLKTPTDDPERLLLVYPVLGLMAGTAFFAMAEEFGLSYVVGAGIIAVAVLNAFVPYWAPLIVAFLANLNLLSAALVLRRLGAPGDRPA
jgi:serine/threonine protein kinase